jgi:membrane protease YdiL (CAAX protease family)
MAVPVEVKSTPIIKMLGVAALVALAIVAIDAALRFLPNYETLMRDSPWLFAHLVHLPQFLVPLLLIWYITKGRLGEYGFNLRQKPPTFTHVRMVALGALVGLLMSVKHFSALISNAPVDVPQPVTVASVLGNLTFQWIVVGLSEETMFRGLIQTYLMSHLSGYVNVLGHSLHAGTVIAALLWGAFHFVNILVMPLQSVVSYVMLTTVAGLAMGYAYQETRSLLTTTIVHNTIFGLPLTIGYGLYWVQGR